MALPLDPSTGKVDFIEFDSPVDLLQALLRQAGGNGLPVDKLGTVRILNLTWRSSNTDFFAIPNSKYLRASNEIYLYHTESRILTLCLETVTKWRIILEESL